MKTLVALLGIGVASLMITSLVWIMQSSRGIDWNRRVKRHRRKYFVKFLYSVGLPVFLVTFTFLVIVMLYFDVINLTDE